MPNQDDVVFERQYITVNEIGVKIVHQKDGTWKTQYIGDNRTRATKHLNKIFGRNSFDTVGDAVDQAKIMLDQFKLSIELRKQGQGP